MNNRSKAFMKKFHTSASGKYTIIIAPLLILMFLISIVPLWATIIYLIMLWILHLYYMLKDDEITIDVSNLHEIRVHPKDSFSYKLENKLERKSHRVYKIQIIIGAIMIIVASFGFIFIWSEGIPEMYLEMKNESSIWTIIWDHLIPTIWMIFISMFIYLGSFVGFIYVFSGIIMLPFIREYEKYQLALKILPSSEQISNENKEKGIEEDWTIVENKAFGYNTILKSRDEWFIKNRKRINRYFNNLSVFDNL